MSKFLPVWAHPRFPLVANELRQFSAIDVRIWQFTERTRFIVPVLVGLLFFSCALISTTGENIFGYLLFPLVVAMAPPAIIVSEILFTRLIISTPARASHMIVGEFERRTWESILSTPLPRYQIVMSKFAALMWNAEHALMPVITLRIILIGFIVIVRLAFDQFGDENLVLLILLGVLVGLMPLFEIYLLSGVGLLVSSRAGSSWYAGLINRSLWMFYRGLTSVVFVLLYTRSDTGLLLTLATLASFPHWLHLVLFIIVPENPDVYLRVFGSIYVLGPVVTGTIGLLLTVRFAQSQRVSSYDRIVPAKS